MKKRHVIGVVVAIAGLASAFHLVSASRASSALDREIAGLTQQLGARTMRPSPSTKQLAARAELVGLLDAVAGFVPEDEFITKSMEHWVPEAPDAAYRAELGARLERYASFFDGLERLPADLWEDQFVLPAEQPGQTSIRRYRGVMVATQALCTRAWLEAQAPGGQESAGRSLGRALAIARVTDDGLAGCLSVREHVELRVLDALERTRAVALDPSDALTAPVRVELARSLGEDRFQRCLVSEARQFVDNLARARKTGRPAWLSGYGDTDVALAHLAWYREMLSSLGEPVTSGDDGQHCVYPPRDVDQPSHVWRFVTALDFRRRQQLSAALRTI